jgi:hypothetical protein
MYIGAMPLLAACTDWVPTGHEGRAIPVGSGGFGNVPGSGAGRIIGGATGTAAGLTVSLLPPPAISLSGAKRGSGRVEGGAGTFVSSGLIEPGSSPVADFGLPHMSVEGFFGIGAGGRTPGFSSTIAKGDGVGFLISDGRAVEKGWPDGFGASGRDMFVPGAFAVENG